MISLAGRDILHSWGKFVFTGLGLGLLIGVTLIMAGVYRGMVDDGQALLDNSGADLWVVQQGTLTVRHTPSTATLAPMARSRQKPSGNSMVKVRRPGRSSMVARRAVA